MPVRVGKYKDSAFCPGLVEGRGLFEVPVGAEGWSEAVTKGLKEDDKVNMLSGRGTAI